MAGSKQHTQPSPFSLRLSNEGKKNTNMSESKEIQNITWIQLATVQTIPAC